MPAPTWTLRLLASTLATATVSALLVLPPAEVAAAATTWPAPVSHEVTAQQPCADVLVVGVRGSGQTGDQSGGFGAEAADVRDRLQEILGDRRRVRQVQVDYQSAPVVDTLFWNVSPSEVSNRYLDSIGSGYDALNAVVDDSQSRCPDESIVLIGYSQGALVVHQSAAVHAADPDTFAGIVLVADPARNGEGVPALGTAGAGTGLTGWAGDLSALPLGDLLPITTSVCNAYDAVCDTTNLFATPEGIASPLGAATAGVAVHTAYTGTPVLQEAAARVAQRVLGYAVPAQTDVDVPIGSPFTVQLGTRPMADGTSATWRFDPVSTAPSSATLTAGGTLTGTFAQQGTVSVQVQVKGAVGGWRHATIGLRVGAGQYCPAADDILDLTATPRTDEEIWTPASRAAGAGVGAASTGTSADDAAVAAGDDLVAPGSTGILESVLVSSEDSSRRDPGARLDGQRLASPAGQIVFADRYSGKALVYRTGDPDPVRSLTDSPVWDEVSPGWLRGDLITGRIEDSSGDEVVWEDLAGTRSGRAAVEGTFLSGSDTGWYESYRWPSTFGCVTDGSLVVRGVDVTGSEVVRTNVAVAPPGVSRGAEPLMAESGPDGHSLGLLLAVRHDDENPTGMTVLGWQQGEPTLRVLGSIPDEEVAGGHPGAWRYWAPGRAYSIWESKMSVSGSAVSVHLAQWWKDPEANGYESPGFGVVTGVVFRFSPGQPVRRWDAQRQSNLLTLPGATLFNGPAYQMLTIGHADGRATASQVSRDDPRGTVDAASDGRVVFMPPGLNGPLSDPWVGSDTLLRGYVYRYDDPAVYTPVVAAALPVLGETANVYNLSVSGDSVSWTDDSVAGGAQWSRGYVLDGETLSLAPERSRTADMTSRSEWVDHAPWREGDLAVYVTANEYGLSDLSVDRAGTRIWSHSITDGAGAYRIHDGRVDLTASCLSYDLHTGELVFETEVWHYDRPVFTDADEGCSLASEGTVAVWVDVDGTVRVLDTAGTAPAAVVGQVAGIDSEVPGYVDHLSIEDGRLLLWVREFPDETTWEPVDRFFTADLRDLAHPGPLVPLPGVVDAIAAGTDDGGGIQQISRSGAAFAIALGSDRQYRPEEQTNAYGGYRAASIQVFSLDSDQPFATLSPATEPNYVYGPAVSLHGSLLGWSDGSGGLVLSRLALPDEPAEVPFTAAPDPTTTGTPAVGSVLTAVAGAWSPEPTALTYQWARNGVAVAGATSATFALTAADAGQRITVAVTGARSGYTTATRTSAAVTVARLLTATPTPTVSGTAGVGSTLTAKPGTWGPAPVTLTYRWQRDGAAISGATSSTYRVASADRGRKITISVTGARTGYTSVTRTSAAVVAGTLTASPVPTVSGTAVVGATLTAKPGTWGPAPVTLSYRWTRNGAAITGGTKATYRLTAADAGRKIAVTVIGSRSGFTSVARGSAAVTVLRPLTATPTPTVSGTRAAGSTLTAKPGVWGPAPVTLAYRWLRDGAAIAGATKATYRLTSADVGRKVAVQVTGTRSGYRAVTRTSASAVVPRALTATPAPKVSGTAAVGSTLTAKPGTWAPGPVTLTYRWYRGGTAIPGATRSTYTATAADAGAVVSVRVTGSRSGYSTVTRASAGVTVLRLMTMAPTPTILGTPKVGQTIRVKLDRWAPAPVLLYYQWFRDGVAVPGATGWDYPLGREDAGRTITVRVAGSSPGYLPAKRTSPGVVIAS